VLQNMLERKRENAPRWDCSDELSWRSMPSWAQVSAPIGCVYFEEHHTDTGAVYYQCRDCGWQSDAVR